MPKTNKEAKTITYTSTSQTNTRVAPIAYISNTRWKFGCSCKQTPSVIQGCRKETWFDCINGSCWWTGIHINSIRFRNNRKLFLMVTTTCNVALIAPQNAHFLCIGETVIIAASTRVLSAWQYAEINTASGNDAFIVAVVVIETVRVMQHDVLRNGHGRAILRNVKVLFCMMFQV